MHRYTSCTNSHLQIYVATVMRAVVQPIQYAVYDEAVILF